jgi:hypothetical protein
MAAQTLKLAGRDFVVLPKREYERLRDMARELSAQDRGDIAESKRRKAQGPSRPYSELRKKLGLA